MATERFRRASVHLDQPAEAWNLSRPEAGSRGACEAYPCRLAQLGILANTFQANPVALAKHGLEPRLEEIVRRRGPHRSRSAGGRNHYVLAQHPPSRRPLRE